MVKLFLIENGGGGGVMLETRISSVKSEQLKKLFVRHQHVGR
jgi:hypothetical protein